jgi:hypothetical protein
LRASGTIGRNGQSGKPLLDSCSPYALTALLAIATLATDSHPRGVVAPL